jgi:hypothetical protein
MEEEDVDSRLRENDEKGTTKKSKAPRWQIPFLRALARTGDVRASAEDAGIDFSTAYARRRGHTEFAAEWQRALEAHADAVLVEKASELDALHVAPSPSHSCAVVPSLSLEGRGINGAQVKRAGHDRWNQRKEKAFFEAATANVKRAAKAAGVSPNAVYARRMRDAYFKAKWAAVLESGRASIEMKLVEAANRSFEPEELDTGAVEPKVSVAEAIRIVQVHGSKKSEEELPNPFAEQAASMTQEDVAELRERIIRKLRRLRDREKPKWIAEGWSFDEEHDHMVPPGWVRASGS